MSESATEKNLTAKQIAALAVLALGQSPAEAAKAAGVNRGTVYRWCKDPTFAGELRRLDGEALKRLGRRLMSLGEKAILALEDALDGDALGGRLRAAALVIDKGPALAELTSVIERLEALEAKTYDKPTD